MNPGLPPDSTRANRTNLRCFPRLMERSVLSSVKLAAVFALFFASAVVVAQDSSAVSTTTSSTASAASSATSIPIFILLPSNSTVSCAPLTVTWSFSRDLLNQFSDLGSANIQLSVTNIGVDQPPAPAVLGSSSGSTSGTSMRIRRIRDLQHGEFEFKPRPVRRQDAAPETDRVLTSFQLGSTQTQFIWEHVDVFSGSWYKLHARSEQASPNWIVDSYSDSLYIQKAGDEGCIQSSVTTSSSAQISATITSTPTSSSTPLIASSGEDATASSSHSSLSGGAKAGIAIGVILGVLTLLALFLVLCRRRNVAQRQANRNRRLSGGAVTEKEGPSGTGILAALGVKNPPRTDAESTAGTSAGFTVLRGDCVNASRLAKIGAGASTRKSTLSSSDEKAVTEPVEQRGLLGRGASPTASNSSIRKGSGSSTQELGVGSDVVPTLPASSPTPRVHPFTNKPPSRPQTWDRASTLIEHFDDSVPVSFYEQLQKSPGPSQSLLQDMHSPSHPSSSLPIVLPPTQVPSGPQASVIRRGSSTSRRKPAPELPSDLHSVITTTSSSAPVEPSPLTAEPGELSGEEHAPPRQRSVSHGHVAHGRAGLLSPPVAAGSLLAAAHQTGSAVNGSKSSLASSVNTQAASLMRSSTGARHSIGHSIRPASEGVPDISSFAGAKEGPVHYIIPDAPEPYMGSPAGSVEDDAVHAELVSHLNRRHSHQSRIRKPSAS